MCNGCHDISTKAISMYNLCIGYNNGNAYRCLKQKIITFVCA